MKSKPLEEIDKLKHIGFYVYKVSSDNTVHLMNDEGTVVKFQLREREMNKFMREVYPPWEN